MSENGITPDFLTELKSKCNIREIVSQYVPLRKMGGRFFGCCPFHNEKTPSFCLNENQGFYHCFGCGASGDVIKFVEEIESVPFIDAIKILAEHANMTMPEFKADPAAEQKREKRDVLRSLMLDANRFYYRNLFKEKEGKAARAYLESRGFSKEIIDRYRLGLSLGYDQLQGYMRRKGYSIDNLKECGLIEGERYSDAFANRIIVPILDSLGNVVAFGGRIYQGETDKPKYKNSNTNSIFEKGRTVYGINFVKEAKREHVVFSELILVEGYMDVIALGAAGVRNVIAGMGTALTMEQAKEIRKLTDKLYVCYDGDGAGRKATLQNSPILLSAGIDIKIVSLPDGKDPDEVVKSEGVDAFRKYLAEALPFVDYKLLLCEKSYDLQTASGRAKYVNAALNVLKDVSNDVEREVYMDALATKSGVTLQTIKIQFSKVLATSKVAVQAQSQERTQSAAAVAINAEAKAASASRFVLNRLLNNAKYATVSALSRDWFADDVYRSVFDWIASHADSPIVIGDMLRDLPPDDKINALLDDPPKFENETREKTYYCDCAVLLANVVIGEKLSKVKDSFKDVADAERRREIKLEIMELQRKLKSGDLADKL